MVISKVRSTPTASPAESPFGAHISPGPTGMNLAQAVGARWLRLHPPNYTKWRVVEQAEGHWVWHDEAIRRLLDPGFALCGPLDRCPDWAPIHFFYIARTVNLFVQRPRNP